MVLEERVLARLKVLEGHLETCDSKRAAFEQELLVSSSPTAKFEIQQRLKKEVLPVLREYEQEYAEILSNIDSSLLPEDESESLLNEVKTATTKLESKNPELPSDAQHLLTQLNDGLNRPETSAAAKLKLSLPIIPLLASYELELDTEKFLTQCWQKLRDFFQRRVRP